MTILPEDKKTRADSDFSRYLFWASGQSPINSEIFELIEPGAIARQVYGTKE